VQLQLQRFFLKPCKCEAEPATIRASDPGIAERLMYAIVASHVAALHTIKAYLWAYGAF
jgi:hypothetical protein